MLDYLLNQCTFRNDGIYSPDATKTHRLFQFIREAVLDAHIPVRKTCAYQFSYIGPNHGAPNYNDSEYFSIVRERDLGDEKSITRDVGIAESNAELQNMHRHYIFNMKNPTLSEPQAIVNEDPWPGHIQLTESFRICTFRNVYDYPFWYDRTSEAFEADEVYSSTGDFTAYTPTGFVPVGTFTLVLRESTGYEDNHETLKYVPLLSPDLYRKKEYDKHLLRIPYIPFAQYYSLHEFVSVLPIFNDPNLVKWRLLHGVSTAYMRGRFARMKELLDNNKLKEEDKEWLIQYK